MAITKVGIMANPPTNIDDYTHILAHLDAYAKQVGNQGMILTEWTNTSGVPNIAKGSYISHGGTLFVVDTEDFALPPPADGTYYLRVSASGASLAVSWVASLAGYAWNAIYNGLYDGSENQILPYMLIKIGTTLEKWKITNLMQGGGFNRVDYLGRVVVGALTCASVDTGHGANELYGMNQGVKTTDAVKFASVDTGQGATEVHLMNQNLRKTDDVEFASVAITGVSKASNGYTRLPNGLLLQWGSGNGSITFPIAFSTVFNVVATQIIGTTTPAWIWDFSNTGMSFGDKYGSSEGGGIHIRPCTYMAIGV